MLMADDLLGGSTCFRFARVCDMGHKRHVGHDWFSTHRNIAKGIASIDKTSKYKENIKTKILLFTYLNCEIFHLSGLPSQNSSKSPSHEDHESNVRHQGRPCTSFHLHNRPSIAIPSKLATQIPPLSLTLVAPKLNSLSPSSTLSMISAKVLTYTAPPNRPSQNTTMKIIHTEGMKKYRECRIRRARLRICKREGA